MTFRLTRVEAPTMDEALAKVRSMLGTDAMIVSTRTFRRGGVLGFGGREVVEVFAADTRSRIENVKRENSSRSRHVEPPSVGALARGKTATSAAKDLFSSGDAARPAGEDAVASSSGKAAASDRREEGAPAKGAAPPYTEFANAPSQIRQEIRQFVSRTGGVQKYSHPFLSECYELLISREVDPRITDRIVQVISTLRIPDGFPDPARVRAIVHAQLANLFMPPPPIDVRNKPRLISLVGPTGVGKTTTIAKLAARAKINERLRVGLVTLDTFRIAAIDQLEKYAEIIGLPMAVAAQPQELRDVIDEFREREVDLVFVDSAGRSHRDEIKMAELRAFMSVLPEVEVHLVLSTTTHGKTLENVASRFGNIGFDRVILTKVDESVSFGALVKTLLTLARPVSFLTDGQNVPDDIMAGDPDRLADLVLKINAQ